ncbi:hypothetical protein CRM22_007816 [Opisthorchis felineus]|uniref:Uncharacterized protein n=1 Tax=Opisthorchis felineus TaxID=147828 RepID=A0A4S2LMG2_OPIFE|nr:hypothetical protein CRM22_007816 [Opisthorchis felineus]
MGLWQRAILLISVVFLCIGEANWFRRRRMIGQGGQGSRLFGGSRGKVGPYGVPRGGPFGTPRGRFSGMFGGRRGPTRRLPDRRFRGMRPPSGQGMPTGPGFGGMPSPPRRGMLPPSGSEFDEMPPGPEFGRMPTSPKYGGMPPAGGIGDLLDKMDKTSLRTKEEAFGVKLFHPCLQRILEPTKGLR